MIYDFLNINNVNSDLLGGKGEKKAIEVRYEDENIWLTQKMLATLYNVEINTINYHIKKIYNDSELTKDSTIRNFRIVQNEGNRSVSRNVVHYNLQMIIALGFKVDNERAVQFRKWANGIVKEYTIKGFTIDDERLKNSGSILTEKYFDELLEVTRKISQNKFSDIDKTVEDCLTRVLENV